jgi:CDP-glucose 4,6-dehydratase
MLEAIRSCNTVKSAVIVTTDKVYLNLESKIKFKETAALGGHDIYSSSKAACEILTESYIKSFYSKLNNCKIATVRSGNCIGGGDWTKDRIVKDCVEAFLENKNLFIRIPNASRPWQHVMEPLFGYLKLAEKLYYDNKRKYIGSWNFGPNIKNNLKVLEVAKYGRKILKSKSKILKTKQIFYESRHLSLDSSKAFKFLKWRTILNAKQALKLTFEWHKFYNNKSLRYQIVNFTTN